MIRRGSPKRLLKNAETKNLLFVGLEYSGLAGGVFQSTLRAAALLSAGLVAIQSGSTKATFLHRASPSNKMTRRFSFHRFSTVSQVTLSTATQCRSSFSNIAVYNDAV